MQKWKKNKMRRIIKFISSHLIMQEVIALNHWTCQK